LQSQLKKQDELITNGHNQSEVLNRQLEQQSKISSSVENQSATLRMQIKQQEKLGEQSLNIIAKQASLADGMNQSTTMTQNNLKIQEQSLGVLKSTSDDLKALNFPIVNGLLFSFKIRVYVEGIRSIWNDNNSGTYQIFFPNDTIATFVKSKIYNFPKSSYSKYVVPYWNFFSNISTGINVSTILSYKLADKNNEISYFENGGNKVGTWAITKNVYFNPQEEYFESEYLISSGAIRTNPDKITNLYSLFDSTKVLLSVKFIGDKNYDLPIKGSKKIVTIKKIVLSDFSQLRYGNNFQFMLNPGNKTQVINNHEVYKLKNLPEHISEQEFWRYCFVDIPLTKS
jgi:hypothetical protein